MYKDIFESIRNEAEKRNLRERTIQLYCSDVSYFLRMRCIIARFVATNFS